MSRNRDEPSDYVTCRHCQRDFRGITVHHLRNIHGYEGDHPILDYKRRFNLKTALCADSRKKISEAKGAFWSRKGHGWTRQKLVAEIRRRHRAGQTLRSKRVPVRLYEAGRRFFGTWQAAVEAAGFDYEKATGNYRWTPARVIAAIRKLADKGGPLHASHVRERHPQLFNAAVKRFPRSWAKAIRAAGLDPDQHRQPRSKWTEQKAADWVQTRLAKRRSVLARDAPRDLQDFVRKRLRTTWTDFIESFGVPYPGVKKRRDWTKAKVLSEIRAQKAKGQPLNYRAIKQDYQALLHQGKKFFGSWDRALRAAGALRGREARKPPKTRSGKQT